MSIVRNAGRLLATTGFAALGGGAIAVTAAAGLVAAARHSGRQGLRGKVVLITGGSRGLGLEIAREFGRAGCLLMLVSRSHEDLQRAAVHLAHAGAAPNAQAVGICAADISTREEAERAVAETRQRFGRVDVLINNAGIITVAPFHNSSTEVFERVMRVNFYAALYMTKAVVEEMRARRSGRIVNIASIGGKVAVPHMLPYTASKFALVGFSEGLHAELAQDGIQVTTVCPGLMRTGSHPQAEFGGNREKEYRWFSLGAMVPGASTSARSAARRIFNATVQGRAEITITPQAWLGARTVGVAPALSAHLAGLADKYILPAPTETTQEPRKGTDLAEADAGPLRKWTDHLQSAHNQPG